MNIKTEEIEKLLSGLLKNYFNVNDFYEFYEKVLSKKLRGTSRENSTEGDYKSGDILNPHNLSTKLDLITTYAEVKFPKKKFLELQLEIGRLKIDSGELASAVYVYEKIINETEKEDEFTVVRAEALKTLGELYGRQAFWQFSFAYINKARLLFKKLNDVTGIASCENLLGTFQCELGDLKKGERHFKKALSLLKEREDIILEGKIEINLGIIKDLFEKYDQSLRHYKKALELFGKKGDMKSVAEIKHNIGMLSLKKKDYQTAVDEFGESIRIANNIGYITLLGISYLAMADAYTRKNDLGKANDYITLAMDIANYGNDKLTVADAYKIKGIIHIGLKDFDLAENYLLTSLRINKDLNNEMNAAETNVELAMLYGLKGMTERKESHLKSALKYYSSIKAGHMVDEIRLALESDKK